MNLATLTLLSLRVARTAPPPHPSLELAREITQLRWGESLLVGCYFCAVWAEQVPDTGHSYRPPPRHDPHLVVDVTDGGRLSPQVVLVGRQLVHDPDLTLSPRGVDNVHISRCLHPVFMSLYIAVENLVGFTVGAKVKHVPQARGIWTTP